MDYYISKISNNLHNSIKEIIETMCKENNINYLKQEYHILFSNEKIFYKNNDVKFTSGSKKYLSFYGKIYLRKKSNIIENIYLQNDVFSFEPRNDEILVISGGINNSTFLENDEDLLHFYVASKNRIGMHDPKTWQSL